MGKTKPMNKKCPQCESEVATATKLCQCGYNFFDKRKPGRPSVSSEDTNSNMTTSEFSGQEGRRRGVRVRKETQTYGTTVPSASLDAKIRSPKAVVNTAKKRRTKDSPVVNDEDTNSEEGAKRKRGRKNREERFLEQEEKLMSKISSKRASRYSLILNNINRTIKQQNFHLEQTPSSKDTPHDEES